jgi:hypothetical protein
MTSIEDHQLSNPYTPARASVRRSSPVDGDVESFALLLEHLGAGGIRAAIPDRQLRARLRFAAGSFRLGRLLARIRQ